MNIYDGIVLFGLLLLLALIGAWLHGWDNGEEQIYKELDRILNERMKEKGDDDEKA